jgi:alpha-L-rhamnosidase
MRSILLHVKSSLIRIILLPLLALGLFSTNAAVISVGQLRCEYRDNPRGLDVVQPRLSWIMSSDMRGQKQTAYQVLVASSAELLASNQGDLWDSGKVVTNQTIHIVYQGKPLNSRALAFWKVRLWDKDDQASDWSTPGSWTMGLLAASDWQAKWIADPDSITNSQTRGPLNGYHSQIAVLETVPKWVAIDLGQSQSIDAVRLFPARPYDWQPDTPGFLFPVRFKIEAASKPDFSDAQLIVDRTQTDVANPGTNAPSYAFNFISARYVRLTVTKLARRDDSNYAAALAEMQVLSSGQNLAMGKTVTALDSIETGPWAKINLVDGVLVTVPTGALQSALPATMVRKSFSLNAPVRQATAYATGLGLYELHLNGHRVGDCILAPEWTNYRKRIQYQVFDVTSLLNEGTNAIGAMLGEGWYAGRLMAVGRNAYGSYPRFLCQVEIELINGQKLTILSDPSWRTTINGPIRSSGIYDGEEYDARKDQSGWDTAGFDDTSWKAAQVFDLGNAQLVWQRNEPIRVIEELKPVKMTTPSPGTYIFDFGQNMVGWCRLSLKESAGTTVRIRHGEMLNSDGSLYTDNLRGAPQINRYTFKGKDVEVFEPHFTYHGFRYVELTGLAAAPTVESIVGRVFYSSAPDRSHFESSNTLINQLMHNIYWTQRANLMSSPNDCPQRDERFGWMGDIQAFSQTSIFNMDMAAFFSKWVRDIRDDQASDGRYPDFAPHPGDPNVSFSGVPAWGDAGTVVPWRMYQNYADDRLLAEHFSSAKRWVEYVHQLNPNLIWSNGRNNDYNDWLNGDTLIYTGWPTTGGAVPQEVFATAFFAHSTEIVAKMARVLGQTQDAITYEALFSQIKAAFNRKFVSADGHVYGDTQAGYALALHFNLLPANLRSKAVQYMVGGLKKYNGHLSTGIQTSHRLMLELSRYGYQDEAYRILSLRDFPSWGMMIENGATTIWERWDGYVKGRGFQDAGMNSFNHWAFGAIGEWVWRNVAGINPDDSAPGYQQFIIAPRPGGDLTWARASYDSIRGRIISDWKIENDLFSLNITVPPNTSATIYLPTIAVESITEGGKNIKQVDGITLQGVESGSAVLHATSGTYSFQTPWRKTTALIYRRNANQLTLSWADANYILQTAGGLLNATNWSDYSSNYTSAVVTTCDQSNLFYRLRGL